MVCVIAVGQGPAAAEWKDVLSRAQQCEALGQGRKQLRKLMVALYGGHSAYHDTKARFRIDSTYQV